MKPYLLLLSFILTAGISQAQFYSNIEFIQNKGQWDPRVKFLGQIPSGAFFIRSTGFTVLQHNPDDIEKVYDNLHSHFHSSQPSKLDELTILHSHSYNVDFIDAVPAFEIVPDKPVNSYNNYFIGNDPSKWASDCKIFQAITLKNVYPNVDVRYYTESGRLKYDIIARPGSDIKKIGLKYIGVSKLELKEKELVISTSVGEIKELSPYTYQSNGKEKKDLNAKYIIRDNIVRFDIKGYDPNSTIIIDPTLVFSSLSGSTADNWGYTATYGPDGSMFGGGISFGMGFPVSPGAFQQTFAGGGGGSNEAIDIGIIKLTPDGTNRVYATYLGGSGNEQPHSLFVDGQGNLVMAGRSSSTDYPVTGAGQIGPGGGWDIVVTKLNVTGTALIGSKRIGGTGNDGVNITPTRGTPISLQQNYGDDGRSEVILDGFNNIYVASCTQSANFPMVGASFQSVFGGGTQDAVILKLAPDVSGLISSSFFGGSGNDAAYVLSLSQSGDLYIAGGTESTNLPGNSAGVISASNNGSIDGFVSIITNNLSAITRTTYLGTGGIDQVYGIQFDKFGFPYVMGQTTGNWPVINATYSNAGAKQFISKLKPDLSAFVYSTVFGKSAAVPSISPVAFLVDRCENVYVSGWGGTFGTYSTSGTTGLPVTPDAIKSTSQDNTDFYFFVLKKDAVSQLYGTFYGQDFGLVDHVDGGTSRFDRNGVVYQAICANCGQQPKPVFPTTPGVWSPNNPGPNCNLAMIKIAFNLAGVGSGVRSSINGVAGDSSGCVPLKVDFTDTIHNASSYEWNFGDGSPQITTTLPATSHTYNNVGNYRVMLVAIDSTTCNIRDTSYLNIRVGNLQALLNFAPVKLNPCDSFKYQFDNLSVAPPARPFTISSFVWDFGDNSPRIIAGLNSVFHNYAAPGTYNVRLILTDTAYCNAPDSITTQLRVAALVKAQFETPPAGCAPYTAIFNNTSLAGQQFFWDFGDGSTSSEINPVHIYNNPGSYTTKLVAIDSSTCNVADSTSLTINVFDKPTADYSFSPDPPLENTPTSFVNLSSPDAVLFFWDFGDGDTLLTSSRSPVLHQYNITGTFNACLIAFNAAGCPDSICKSVRALINPAVDVPTGFTPLSGDINSKILVRGFGISKMKFIIWSRWGEKVFETDNRNTGWDGRYKGKLLPMDVYAYTLQVEFFDGTKATKKGDITLIR